MLCSLSKLNDLVEILNNLHVCYFEAVYNCFFRLLFMTVTKIASFTNTQYVVVFESLLWVVVVEIEVRHNWPFLIHFTLRKTVDLTIPSFILGQSYKTILRFADRFTIVDNTKQDHNFFLTANLKLSFQNCTLVGYGVNQLTI